MLTARFLTDHRRTAIAVVILIAMTIIVPLIFLGTPANSRLHMPAYLVALLGKYLCFALLAVSLDLVWGYCGILSLGHGAFFALGGYAMGMYLMRQIGARGVYANPFYPTLWFSEHEVAADHLVGF